MRRPLVALAILCLTFPACVSTQRTPAHMTRTPARIPIKPGVRGHTSRIQRKDIDPPFWSRAVPRPGRNESFPPAWLPRRLSRQWRTIVIHHSATAKGGAKAFDAYHRKRGWDGLGYHFVIGNGSNTPDGHVEVGARWKQQKTGAHCKTPNNYYNAHGIGICLVGDFTKSRPTSRQMASLRKLTRVLARVCDIPAMRVTTHRNVTGGTACPGSNFPLEVIRSALASDETAQYVAMGNHTPATAHSKQRTVPSAALAPARYGFRQTDTRRSR